MQLHHARTWRLFSHPAREALAAYNTFFTVVAFTGLSYWGSLRDAAPERLQLPARWDGRPSLAANETAARAWLVDLGAPSAGAILAAFGPAVVLVLLFFF